MRINKIRSYNYECIKALTCIQRMTHFVITMVFVISFLLISIEQYYKKPPEKRINAIIVITA